MEDRAAEGVDKWNRKKYTKYLEEEKVAQKGDLLSFRPDIKVLDATIRDGGLVNDFYFTDEFIHNLYKANVKAGVDYMEFGYRADKEMFDVDAYGPWKFAEDDKIREVVGDNDADLKISIMADVGRCNYKEDIHDRSDSPVDLIRVATDVNTMPAAIDMIEDAHRKGYETTCNIMAISNAKESDINKALEMLGKSCVDGIYIVDRFASAKLVGDSIGISPFLTLLSMFIGYRWIGMLGLIIGIPVGMIIKALFEQGVFESQIRGIKILAKDINEFRKY